MQIDCQVVNASFSRPYLAVALEIDPALVRRVDGEMLAMRTDQPQGAAAPEDVSVDRRGGGRAQRAVPVHRVFEVVLRANKNVASDIDRHVLAPQYQHEIVYWLLQSNLGQNLRTLASADVVDRQILEVIDHVRGHLAEPLSVATMAALAHLSPSAFAHRFRIVTGRPPHQFVKEMRLHRARDLLADGGLTVSQVSVQVGYASVSQFTSSFRERFGVTPGCLVRQ